MDMGRNSPNCSVNWVNRISRDLARPIGYTELTLRRALTPIAWLTPNLRPDAPGTAETGHPLKLLRHRGCRQWLNDKSAVPSRAAMWPGHNLLTSLAPPSSFTPRLTSLSARDYDLVRVWFLRRPVSGPRLLVADPPTRRSAVGLAPGRDRSWVSRVAAVGLIHCFGEWSYESLTASLCGDVRWRNGLLCSIPPPPPAHPRANSCCRPGGWFASVATPRRTGASPTPASPPGTASFPSKTEC